MNAEWRVEEWSTTQLRSIIAVHTGRGGTAISSLLLTLMFCASGTSAQQVDPEPVAADLPAPVRAPDEITFRARSFTFARIRYSGDPGGFRGGANRWATDWPQADFISPP